MRSTLTDALEVLGVASIALGFWLILPAFGLIAAGVGLILVVEALS